MPLVLLFFAAVAVFAVVAGELGEMPWRRRLADAGRSRIEAPAQRASLRR